MKILLILLTFLNLIQIIESIEGKKSKENEDNEVVVLITGCSSGIGKSLALELKKTKKYKVYASMRTIKKEEEEKEEEKEEKENSNLEWIQLDVTSLNSVEEAVSYIIKKEGRIDVLINNAGYGLVGTVETVDISDAKDMFEVNLWGVVRVMQAVLPFMRNSRKGHIINLSSTSGIRGIPANDFYTSSKFALEGLCDSLRYTLAGFNIYITNVNPGPVRTSFGDRYGDKSTGGRGKRLVNDTTGYLLALEERAISSFASRVVTDGQSSEEVARVVINLIIIGRQAKKPSDVPFNIGTNRKTQSLIDELCHYPTGWGGVYTDIMLNMPPVPKEDKIQKSKTINDEL